MTDTGPVKGRTEWVDIAKGLGITMVVTAHVLVDTVQDSAIAWFLYLFHMPLFFMISGYLQKAENGQRFFVRKAKSLLVPYFVFLIVLATPLFAKTIVALAAGGIVPWSRYEELLWGGEALTGVHGVFWFVTCLFAAQNLYNAIILRFHSALDPRTVVSILCMAILAYVVEALGIWMPWNLSVAPAAIVFLWAGNTIRAFEIEVPWWSFLILGLTASAGVIWAFSISHSVDMKSGWYGVPVFGFILATVLSCITFVFAKLLSKSPFSRPLSKLGEAAIIVMFLHQAARILVQGAVGANAPFLIVIGLAVPLACFFALQRSPVTSALFLGRPHPA